MGEKHQQLLEQIRKQEQDQVKMPHDNLSVSLNLSQSIEEVKEFLDDPEDRLAKTDQGLLYRMKLKITLSYRQAPGNINMGHFKNV